MSRYGVVVLPPLGEIARDGTLSWRVAVIDYKIGYASQWGHMYLRSGRYFAKFSNGREFLCESRDRNGARAEVIQYVNLQLVIKEMSDEQV